MGRPEIYGSGTVPWTSDTNRMLLVKLLKVAGSGSVTYGSGPPIGIPTPTQTIYVDETAGQIYLNVGGVWTLYTSGTISGVTGVFAYSGSGPMPTATGAALCIGAVGSSAEGLLWKKTSAGTNNTDWVGI